MTVTFSPDHAMQSLPVFPPTIFTLPVFRTLLGQEFKLTPLQVHLQLTAHNAIRLPAFCRHSLGRKKTLILGAGFDKTGSIPALDDYNYADLIAKLIQALIDSDIDVLELRTTQYLPFLLNESDKVELNIDINPNIETIWDNLSTNTRKNIRRPLKRGFTSEIGNSAELLEQFYQLYRMSLHDIGSLAHSKIFFEKLLQECRDYIEIFVGYMQGIPVVASLSFSSKDEIYGAWSGIHTDYKKHNVFLAMLWQITEYCGKTGRKTYNLGRSSKDSNPYQFKLKLANRQQPIYYYRIPTKPLAVNSSKTRQAASWLIRHSPEIVMNSLSRTLLHNFY